MSEWSLCWDSFQSFLDSKCHQEGRQLWITVVRDSSVRMEVSQGDGPFRVLTLANSKDITRLKLGGPPARLCRSLRLCSA